MDVPVNQPMPEPHKDENLDATVAQYQSLLAGFGLQATHLAVDHKGTLLTVSVNAAFRSERRILPVLRTIDTLEELADVRVTTLIGEGGMGRVMAAEQVALGRQVAVKILRTPEPADSPRSLDLLREAVVAGRLEHPNIVPVYLLGITAEGSPLFVMRRVEGVPWSRVLAYPETTPDFFQTDAKDPLFFGLSVFSRVCEAVQFAHSRGIVHRDLKPDNVMLGTYGEVYVVDWGLAVSTKEDPQIPHVRDATTLCGTPGYMAPEMACPASGKISERSDIYLLGGVLHELITGRMPHDASSIIKQLALAYKSMPLVYPDSVPRELQLICRRAMAAHPEHRYATVDALRRAVQDFLQHRGSWALAKSADERAHALIEAMDANSDQIQELFTECRFGYRQALQAWPENTAATDGLQFALERMIEHEIRGGNLGHASALLRELPVAQPKLAQQITHALAQSEKDVIRLKELERFRKDSDTTVNVGERAYALGFMSIGWFVLSMVGATLDYKGIIHFGYREAIGAITLHTSISAAVALYILFVRRPNAAIRRLLWATCGMGLGLVSHWLICSWMYVPLTVALVQFLWWVAGGWMLVGLLVDKHIGVTGVVFGATAIAISLAPRWQLFTFGFGSLFAFGYLALAWWPSPKSSVSSPTSSSRSRQR